jgi:hypothetical protein
MANRAALFFILTLGILSAAGLSVVVTSYTPTNANEYILILFFSCLAGFLTSISAILWHSLKHMLISRIQKPSLWVSIRQCFIFSTLIVLGLFFHALHILTVWDMIPLTIAAIFIEFFFQAEKGDPITPTLRNSAL